LGISRGKVLPVLILLDDFRGRKEIHKMAKEKVLTENQQKFLDALFGEAHGDPELAKKLAGYAESVRVSEIVKSLKQEIVKVSLDVFAVNSVKAALEQIELLHNPTQAGALTKLKVIESILNRAGAAEKTDGVNVNVPAGGIFIMPAKEAPTNDGTTGESEGTLSET
jgi:hypothetical protein